MICIFPPDATDFDSNGLCVLTPTTCTVTETLNGEWELAMKHPLDDRDKWTYIRNGCILRAPVPAAMTPRTALVKKVAGWKVYKVSTSKSINLRASPADSAAKLGSYAPNKQMILLSDPGGGWYEVKTPDGKRGYMKTSWLTYVKTVPASFRPTGEVLEEKQLRDQPFRIYRVVQTLTDVEVYARHLFYDLADNMILSYKPSGSVAAGTVINTFLTKTSQTHPFNVFTDLTSTAEEVAFEFVNPVEAIYNEDGILSKFGGEVARDWFDLYIVARVGIDTDVVIRQGKNLTGISFDVDESTVVTSIIPTGEDKNGKVLYTPEKFIQSPLADHYPHIKYAHLPVSDAKEDSSTSKTKVYQKLRKAAQAEYDSGCDLPTVTLDVDFLSVDDTEEYRDFHILHNLFLGDSVAVVVPKLGLITRLRMTQYTYDCLLRKYTKCTLGSASEALEGSTVSGSQIAVGSINGAKLVMETIGSGQLATGAVGSLQIKTAAIGAAHIENAAISNAHIADATIEKAKITQAAVESLSADALEATSAHIQQLAAEHATTDQLYSALADIGIAKITTAQIDWASIASLQTVIANVANAQIQSADIEFAQIVGVQADTVIAAKMVGGQLQISNLAVNEANMCHLSVGDLLLRGADGAMYAVTIDAQGQIQTTKKLVIGSDVADLTLDAGQKLVKNSITADCLNVQEIFANNATIADLVAGAISANTIDAGKLRAGSITTSLIAPSVGQELVLTSNPAITDLQEKAANPSVIIGEETVTLASAVGRIDAVEEDTGTLQEGYSTLQVGMEGLTAKVTVGDETTMIRATEDGVYVGKSGNIVQSRVSAGSFDVIVGETVVTSLGNKRQQLGSLVIYETSDGGHAFISNHEEG